MSTAAALAPTFWSAVPSPLADPSALVVTFAPGVVALIEPLLVPLADMQPPSQPPGERCWFELRGGTGAASDETDVLAYSLTPEALTVICADGGTVAFERSGLRFPQLDRALETDVESWRVLFVLYVGPFLALCALLNAPGILSKSVERSERQLGAAAAPVRYRLVEIDPTPSATIERDAWLATMRGRLQ